MVVLHRSPNRDCRHQRDRLRRALAEATERAMHRCDQTPDLIDTDTVLSDVLRTISATRLGSTFWALLSSAISFVPTSLIGVYVVEQVSIAISQRPNF